MNPKPDFHYLCETIFVPGQDYRTGDIQIELRQHMEELYRAFRAEPPLEYCVCGGQACEIGAESYCEECGRQKAPKKPSREDLIVNALYAIIYEMDNNPYWHGGVRQILGEFYEDVEATR